MNIALIQARENSNRLPKKVLLPLGDKTVLDWVHLRTSKSKLIDKVVVITGNKDTNKNIIELCERAGYQWFSGSDEDVLSRYYEAAKELISKKDDNIIRITADCPLIDPLIIDQTIDHHIKTKADYTSNNLQYQYPDGMDCEVMKFNVLENAYLNADQIAQREHVTKYIYDNYNTFKISNLIPEEVYPNLRLTLDHKEDYSLITFIYEKLNRINELFNLNDITVLYESNKELFNINENISRNEGISLSEKNTRFVRNNFARLILGTATLGMQYGIKNSNGVMNEKSFKRIIEFAANHGIYKIDTAYAYGDAELKLGNLKDDLSSFKIFSKIGINDSNNKEYISTITHQIHESLESMNQSSIYAYLLHKPIDMKDEVLLNQLSQMKSDGLFKKLGVSVYTKKEALEALEIDLLDIIQVKYNILDRELEELDFFEKAKQKNKEIIVRSVFLQGILLDSDIQLSKFNELSGPLEDIKLISNEYSLTLMDLALFYVLSNQNLDGIIVGFDSIKQFEEIISSIQRLKPNDLLYQKLRMINMNFNKDILNPTNW